MESIGFIKDKKNKLYDVQYYKKSTSNAFNFYIKYNDNKIGELTFTTFPNDKYAYPYFIDIDSQYQGKGLYVSFLTLANDFFKTQGFNGIYSPGESRNEEAEKSWSKIKNKRVIHVNGFDDYIMEHVKTYDNFFKKKPSNS